MKVRLVSFLLLFGLIVSAVPAKAATCTPTGFVRDSINLTAALINPVGTVSGDVDATGCNIGIYYGPGATGRVQGANVHDANYFGIVNNGANVPIYYNTISNIGEKPFNGSQHGVGIYLVFGSAANGHIIGNTIWNYQKGGIVVNGTSQYIYIADNHVIGFGPVGFIAQNGIQVGFGAKVSRISGNFVSGNSYTGANLAASGGILIVGGDCYGGAVTKSTAVSENKLIYSDVGVWLSNLDAACNATMTVTNIAVKDNDITSNAVVNTTGNGPSQGYQAGIADQGNYDTIKENDVCGPGYIGPITPGAAVYNIDVTATNNVRISGNSICQGDDPLPGTPSLYVQADPYL